MNVVNRALTWLFDLCLRPVEVLGQEFALISMSGLFGVLALLVFKHISHQKGIKRTKDRIKGHMIEIRIYQNDLGLVSKAIGKVLLRNFQYLALNFGPFVPLAIPFTFVVAQMVVRYGFEPAPIHVHPGALLAGQGTTLCIELARGREDQAADVRVLLPEGLVPVSKLVPLPSQGLVRQEFAATRPGLYQIEIHNGEQVVSKSFVAQDPTLPDGGLESRPRWLQGQRVSGPFHALLWPAEDTLSAASGIASVRFSYLGHESPYPESDLGWLPGSGPLGVILVFLVASMAFGLAALKPLGVQI